MPRLPRIQFKNLKQELERLLQAPSAQEIQHFRAASPADRKSWFGAEVLFRELTHVIRTHDISTKSASLTYSFGLSVTPMLALAFTLFKSMGGFTKILDDFVIPLINKHFGSAVGTDIAELLTSFVSNLQVGTLGAVAMLTFIITITNLLTKIEGAFNEIFGTRSKRPLFQRIGNYWILISLTPLVLLASSQKLAQLLAQFEFGRGAFQFLVELPLMHLIFELILQSLVFAILLSFFPYRRLSARAVGWAALCTALMFEGLQFVNVKLVQLALEDSVRTQIYGSVPLIITLLFYWIKLVWFVVLTGACLCSVLQRLVYDTDPSSHQAPFQDVTGICSLFALICEHFHISSSGIGSYELRSKLGISMDELNSWTSWLEDRGAIFEVDDGRQGRFYPSSRGLQMEQNVDLFLQDALNLSINSHNSIKIRTDLNQYPQSALNSNFFQAVIDRISINDNKKLENRC